MNRKKLRNLTFKAKPSKCPNCGGTYFNWVREERGGEIWACNSCGYEIKD